MVSILTHQKISVVLPLKCLSLAVLFLCACEPREIVINDLDQKDANIALVMLRDKNIDAQKELGPSKKNITYQIKVKKHQAQKALRLLVYNQLPTSNRAGLKEVYPPGSSGLIPTKTDESARLIMAMQGEIEALLKAVPGISDAHVVFSIDRAARLNQVEAKKTASVALIYRPQKDDDKPPLSDQEVKSLVSASIGGLDIRDIIVVQKKLTPIDFLETPDTSRASPLLAEVPRPMSKKSFWFLLALTLISMIIAAYSVIRLHIHKRFTQ